MKKAIVQGKALLRVVLPVLLLVFGLQTLSAQASLSDPDPLTGKAVMAELMNVDLMSDTEALDVLILAYKDLLDEDQNVDPLTEVTIGVKLEYYQYLIGQLETGGGIEDVLTASVVELQALIARYKVGPTPLEIFQETVALVSN